MTLESHLTSCSLSYFICRLGTEVSTKQGGREEETRCWKDARTAQCGERVSNTHLSILEGADYLQEGTDERGVGPTQDLPRHAVLSHPDFVPSLLMGFLDTLSLEMRAKELAALPLLLPTMKCPPTAYPLKSQLLLECLQ